MQKWSLFKESGKWVIRRWEDGKYKRLPLSKYRHVREDEAELKALVDRLNAPIRVRDAVALKHAFINDELLAEYQEYLRAKIPTQRNADCEYGYLYRYFLTYFIYKLGLENPLEWHKVHETKWATYLQSDPDVPGSAKVKRAIVQAANRFMHWLHLKRPTEVPSLKFTPLSRAVYKAVEARREMNDEIAERRVIPEADLRRIREGLQDERWQVILPHVELGDKFGLRRSEILALELDDVRERNLKVRRQLVRLGPPPVYEALKGRKARKVPYWFAKPAQAYEWVSQVLASPMHPDTLTDRWNDLMAHLGLDYDFHDLRHTFITRAAWKFQSKLLDVRDAAGHEDLKTTQGYLHEKPSTADRAWKPPGKKAA